MCVVQIIEWHVTLRRGARSLARFVVLIPQNGRLIEMRGELRRGRTGGLYTRPAAEFEMTTSDGLRLPVSVRWPAAHEARIDALARTFWNAGGNNR